MSINKVILLGNLGKEPEVKTFDNGGKIASFNLATTKKGYTAKNGTQVADKTEWHNIVAFSGLADICEKYLHKGSKVYVEGEIRYREYEKDGQKKYVTEILCDNLEMCDKPQNVASTGTTPTQVNNPIPSVETRAKEALKDFLDSNPNDGLPF